MRLTTKNVEKFQHDGLVVDTGWSEFNYAKADPKAQESFRAHVGRFVQIHPDDVDQLAKVELALEGGRIIKAETEPAKNEPTKPPAEDNGKGNGKGKGEPASDPKSKDAK